MRQKLVPAIVACCLLTPRLCGAQDAARWEQEAQRVTIIRDDWGIAHVHGVTDADAVFGLMYAQAEDDFNRVETDYINALGRLAEAEGDSVVYQDLRMKLFINPDSMKALYARSPAWLQTLMNAFADGLNFYLYRHPEVKPRVITRFEPWMALAFSEGSIGGDIERVNLRQLGAFYGHDTTGATAPSAGGDGPAAEPSGSNGIAIAPSNTLNHHALFLINPHTSFFFRAEVQVTSDEGLNAYGAVTWGQFFVYQGFNDRVGWMHTSSGADAIDEYLETIVKRGDSLYYRYGHDQLPLTTASITVPYKTASGMDRKTFTVYYTRHGPIVRQLDGKWVSIRLMQDPMHALIQSYSRTRARSYQAFRATMELHTNSSNNTVYADADGNIAYFHANFIPRRDTSFDWTRPVDGSNPATDWHGLLSVDETPHLLNPASGWLYNSNNWPWSAAGRVESAAGRLPPLRGDRRGIRPRAACHPGTAEPEDLYPGYAPRRGVRQLSHRVRHPAAAAFPRLHRHARCGFAESAAGRTDPRAAELGPPLVGDVGGDEPGGVLGRGIGTAGVCRRPAGGNVVRGLRGPPGAGPIVGRGPGGRLGPAQRRLRNLEDTVGRDQPVSASDW